MCGVFWLCYSFFMKHFLEPKLEINSLKSEHLNEGVSPIMACVGSPRQFAENPGTEEEFWNSARNNNPDIRNVDYYGDSRELKSQNFKNAGEYSYVISPVDETDKFSAGFKDCTGVIVTGVDKKTGQNVSFLSHEDPTHFLDGKKNKSDFIASLQERLLEIKEKSEGGTIDAVVVGGNYYRDDEEYLERYKKSIELLSREISKIFGFEPVIMTGPKSEYGKDDVFFDNKNRRLYIRRPVVGDSTTESFVHSDIKNQGEKWL